MILLDSEQFSSLDDFIHEYCKRYDCTRAELPTVVGEFHSTAAVEAIHEHRRGVREQMGSILDTVESRSRPPMASEMRRYDALDRAFTTMG